MKFAYVKMKFTFLVVIFNLIDEVIFLIKNKGWTVLNMEHIPKVVDVFRLALHFQFVVLHR